MGANRSTLGQTDFPRTEPQDVVLRQKRRNVETSKIFLSLREFLKMGLRKAQENSEKLNSTRFPVE